jgi:D-alanine-D-alanine ligase
MSLRVVLLHSADAALAHGEAHDALAVASVREEIDAVAAACRMNRYEPIAVEASDPKSTLDALEKARPDVVFNLAESVGGEARLEAAVAWLLEWARIPYTGSGPIALTLALTKPLARAVLAAHGVGVPEGFVMGRSDGPVPAEFRARRAIVKPSREDASHGIASESVVHDEVSLRARVRYVLECYAQPALVEEFIDGREVNVGLLARGAGLEVLPLS